MFKKLVTGIISLFNFLNIVICINSESKSLKIKDKHETKIVIPGVFAKQKTSHDIYSIMGIRKKRTITNYYFEKDIVGPIPVEIVYVIKQLYLSKKSLKILNRMIIHGPPGNGKSTIVKKISDLTNGEFISVAAPAIVGKYLGQGVEFINNLFEDALKKSYIKEKRVIIFIDEIDAIASFNTSELKAAHTEALQALWLNLDKYKDNPNIFVVCATNDIEKIHNTLLDRFGTNMVEIKNPTYKKRKSILKHYFKEFSSNIPAKTIEKLAKKCSGFSARSLENLVTQIIMKTSIEDKTEITDDLIWSEYSALKNKYGKIKQEKAIKEFYENFIKFASPAAHLLSLLISFISLYKQSNVANKTKIL